MISAIYFLTKKFEITILFVAIIISLGCQIGDLLFSPTLKGKPVLKILVIFFQDMVEF